MYVRRASLERPFNVLLQTKALNRFFVGLWMRCKGLV